MRFGISATSLIVPKNFLTRLRPVNVCAIFLSRFDFGGLRGRLSEQPQSIATIRTGVGAVRFYVIRAWPEPPHTTVRRDRSFGSRPLSCPRPPGHPPGISFSFDSRP